MMRLFPNGGAGSVLGNLQVNILLPVQSLQDEVILLAILRSPVPPQYLRLGQAEGKMPASYRIDKRNRLIVSTATGVLTTDDMVQHLRRLMKDKDFDPTFSQLVDFDDVTEIAVATDDVRKMAEKSIFSPGARRALVAEKSDVAFGLSRMFEILRDLKGDRDVRVFRDREQALAWLFAKDAG